MPTEAGNWLGFVVPEDLEGTTSGQLQGKRSGDLQAEGKSRTRQPGPAREVAKAEQKVRAFFEHTQDLKA